MPDADTIRSLLTCSDLLPTVEVVAATGSTNADLAARARAGGPPGLVRIAAEQTAGRGRLDRTWVSPPGASVSLSLLVRPEPLFTQWGWLSLLAGMAVAGAVAEFAPSDASVRLKWPNDVLIRSRKVCGILSERIERADGALAVVGLGINLSLAADDLPVPTATSLAMEGIVAPVDQLVAAVLNRFAVLYGEWSERGALRAEYTAVCASIGAPLSIQVDEGHRVTGVGDGVDEYGRLLVRTDAGVRAFAVGDVVHARLD